MISKKRKTIKEDTLWKWFSLYIRLRDAGRAGHSYCRSCGARKHYKELQAGHFVSRRLKATKYDEANVHSQCPRCNMYLNGNQSGMSSYITRTYGEKKVQELYDKSRIFTKKLNQQSIKFYADMYREKAKALAEEKAINIRG